MPRPPAPLTVSEELAQARNMRQVIFFLARQIEQRDRQLADALARVVAGQAALVQRLDQVAELVAQAGETSERERLESFGHIVQGNEMLRRLREEIHEAPAAMVAALATDTLRGQRPPVEVGPRHSPSAADDLAA